MGGSKVAAYWQLKAWCVENSLDLKLLKRFHSKSQLDFIHTVTYMKLETVVTKFFGFGTMMG